MQGIHPQQISSAPELKRVYSKQWTRIRPQWYERTDRQTGCLTVSLNMIDLPCYFSRTLRTKDQLSRRVGNWFFPWPYAARKYMILWHTSLYWLWRALAMKVRLDITLLRPIQSSTNSAQQQGLRFEMFLCFCKQ